MVNTVALVGQQAAYIRRHSRHSVGEYSGDMNVDYWSKDKWQEELSKNQVGYADVAMSEESVLLGCDIVLYMPFLMFGGSYCQTVNVNLGLHATVSSVQTSSGTHPAPCLVIIRDRNSCITTGYC